jgi:hypothetical protein
VTAGYLPYVRLVIGGDLKLRLSELRSDRTGVGRAVKAQEGVVGARAHVGTALSEVHPRQVRGEELNQRVVVHVNEFGIEKFRTWVVVRAIGVQTYSYLPITAPSIILIKVFES